MDTKDLVLIIMSVTIVILIVGMLMLIYSEKKMQLKPNIIINVQKDELLEKEKGKEKEKDKFSEVTKDTPPQPAQPPTEIEAFDDDVTVTDIQPAENKPVCHNESINYKFSEGKEGKKPYSTSCSLTTMTSENPETYFKDKFKIPRLIMEPKDIMGFNYMNYNDNPNPYNIGNPLYDKNKPSNVPVGMNYQM